jgi:uncharacterized protein (DUF2336 family)
VSASDFRQIAARSESGKAERLFRAAISAFCSLTRPSRREIAQLEDLALPLFESVSVETKRFAAAALSECASAPAALVGRLCNEGVDVAAPLLIRSSALTDVDLIALIGRHGLPHAHAIARRPRLHPTIADLVRALERPRLIQPESKETTKMPAPLSPDFAARDSIEKGTPRAQPGERAENARRRLRTMMRPAEPAPAREGTPSEAPATIYRKLRDGALTGNTGLLAACLAELLRIDPRRARSIAETETYTDLLIALRALTLNEEQAFIVAAAAFPRLFGHAEAVRLFLERYRLCDPDTAKGKVRDWRAAGLSEVLRPTAANEASSSGHRSLSA